MLLIAQSPSAFADWNEANEGRGMFESEPTRNIWTVSIASVLQVLTYREFTFIKNTTCALVAQCRMVNSASSIWSHVTPISVKTQRQLVITYHFKNNLPEICSTILHYSNIIPHRHSGIRESSRTPRILGNRSRTILQHGARHPEEDTWQPSKITVAYHNTLIQDRRSNICQTVLPNCQNVATF